MTGMLVWPDRVVLVSLRKKNSSSLIVLSTVAKWFAQIS
jgi:hypothetical protein